MYRTMVTQLDKELNFPALQYIHITTGTAKEAVRILYDPDNYFDRGVYIVARSCKDGKLYANMSAKHDKRGQVLLTGNMHEITYIEGSALMFMAERKSGLEGYNNRYLRDGSVEKWKGTLTWEQ